MPTGIPQRWAAIRPGPGPRFGKGVKRPGGIWLLVLILSLVGLGQPAALAQDDQPQAAEQAPTESTEAAGVETATADADTLAAAGVEGDPTTPSPEDIARAEVQRDIRYYLPRVLVLLLVGAIIAGILIVRAGHVPTLREIPGLMVFDEAVARATEMGRPTLFTAGGASDLKRVQTFAAMPMLRKVAELSGELGNRLIVPVCYPETIPVHVNAMKDGYAEAGAADMFHADDVHYYPGGQFFFAIASMGWMMRERPATCFYFGHWEADSLLFAETGQTLNAMQIAGTDQLYQIPFFVASCDYTIIGEEFWAASAKMSEDPNLLGSVAAQDVYKISALAFIVIGSLLASWAWFNSRIDFLDATFKG